MKLARQARRMGPLLLLTALVVGAHAADDDEWAPAGDHQKIKASVPGANAPAEPAAEAAISAAAGSPALQPFVAKVAEVNAMARQGDYAGARQLARQSAIEVAAVGVTGDFIKHRATLAAAFTLFAGRMEALLGQPTAAGRAFAAIKIMAVGDDLKAQAAEADACTAMLDYDFGQAASLERRARQQHREALQPAFDGAAALFGGRPQPALEGLKQFLGKGQNAGFTSLYATAAALCLNRLPEAASYFGRPETATTAIWPCYFLIGGLLDGAGGGALGAKMKFDEGARREHTRYRVNTVLAAVATMASGDVPAGAMALSRSTPNAPGFLRPVLVDLLANPSRAAAVQALATPRYWLMVNGYQPGELLAVKAEELPAMPAEAAPDVTIAPAEAGDAPAAAGPADPATAAATDASPAPAPASDGVPADPGVTSINPTTQAAKAYRSAVTHIANHAYGEAEAALDYSIRNEAFPEALLARGQLRYLRGEYRGAAADYAWAVRLRPDWAEAVYSLAQATDRLGDPRRASQLFGAALELGLPPALAEYARSRAGDR